MKSYIFSLALISISFLYIWSGAERARTAPLTQEPTVSRFTQGLPVLLVIPAINVTANIQHLGVTPEGEMEVPENVADVSWFKLGSLPGKMGSAVIAGHVNDSNGDPGVFIDLNKLKKDDTISVLDDKGKTTVFIVREIRLLNPGFAEEVFNANHGTHLNLITCDGVWDETTGGYSKRLVVFSNVVR